MKLRFLLLWLFSSVCAAQPAEFVAQQWQVSEGLPQSTVRCIAQSHDGYLWIGTWNGLARFDGVHMTIFRTGSDPAFQSPNIKYIFCDSRGSIWIATDPGGLLRYKDHKFERIDSSKGVCAKRISFICEDHAGRIWISAEKGIFVYNGTTFLHYTEADGIPDNYTSQVMPLPDGRMYIGVVNDYAVVRLQGETLVVEETGSTGGHWAAIDTAGAIWYEVHGQGLIHRTRTKKMIDRRLAGVDMRETFILHNGDRWVMTPHDIHIVTDTTITVLSEVDHIALSSITTVFEDREGNIWLGKEGGGLIRLRNKIVTTYGKATGFPFNIVACGMESEPGHVLIGTWDAGLQQVWPRSHAPHTKVALPSPVRSILSMHRTHDKKLYFGSWAHGLYVLEHGHLQKITSNYIHETTSIVSIDEDVYGALWVATAHDGLVMLNGNEEKNWNTASGISGTELNVILAARSGDIWMSIEGNGVQRLSQGKLLTYRKGTGLNDDNAYPLYEDDAGAIWIGTNMGLTRYKHGTFSFVTEAQGLFDNAVTQIIQDDEGNFWIGAIHGISRIRKEDLNAVADGRQTQLHCLTVGKEDGMIIDEVNRGGTPHSWKTSDGALWFCSAQGAVVLDPRSVAANPVPPMVIIEDAWIENSHVPFDTVLQLQAGESKLELAYTAINFSAPSKIRFKYFLEGADKELSDAGTERQVRYTNLNPGRYSFHVIASNNAGVWNTRGAAISIIVLPPYYKTWWFRSLIVLLAVTMVASAIYWRIRKINHERVRQREVTTLLIQNQERERQRMAQEMHDVLGQELLIIKNRALMGLKTVKAGTKEHSHLEQISQSSTSMLKRVREIAHDLRPPELDRLGLSETLRAIIAHVSDASSFSLAGTIDAVDGLIDKEDEINIVRIVQEALNNIVKYADAKNVFVDVMREGPFVLLRVKDDGKGFRMEQITPGMGFAGISERVRILHGSITIQSEPGKGTTIISYIPIHGTSKAT
jgi:signal transduction histidine kinase/ligand-binding sensor domain-containing protein